jgi:hypothetical protein
MPDLLSIPDAEALDNRYIDKWVIYVEGDDDESVWTRTVGRQDAERIEFKVPSHAGSGFQVVFQRVRKERPANPKIYGLVDGESAASIGSLNDFLDCRNSFFVIGGTDFDGIVFLCDHELETLLLRHAQVSLFIVNDASIKDLGVRLQEDVDRDYVQLARRFFIAALFKYVSAELKHHDPACDLLDVGRFRSGMGTMEVIREMKHLIDQQGGMNRADFLQRLYRIWGKVRTNMRDDGDTAEVRLQYVLRLADGKGLMVRIQSYFNMSKTWQGHLVDQFARSGFARRFRDELFEYLERVKVQ